MKNLTVFDDLSAVRSKRDTYDGSSLTLSCKIDNKQPNVLVRLCSIASKIKSTGGYKRRKKDHGQKLRKKYLLKFHSVL